MSPSSSSSSTSSSRSQSPGRNDSALSSTLHLPPSLPATSAEFYESDLPLPLTDHLLHPPSRPNNARSNSWKLLTGGGEREEVQDRSHNESATERTRLLNNEQSGNAPEEPSDSTMPRTSTHRHRNKHSRSQSQSNRSHDHQLAWYRRPSPIWLLPGTFLMAISMGMTYAPKLEIYTQLICRSMDPQKSGVEIPPPISSESHLEQLFYSHSNGRGEEKGMVEFEYVGSLEREREREEKKREKDWQGKCHRSSAVQSAVARLALILTLMMGILSSLTTGWWGSFSDRKGRKPVLILALFGTVAMDSVFLITVNYHSVLSYNFLLLGPVLDGLLGGFSTAQATTNAYLSDCTSPGSRAKIFSLLSGLMFAGFALGPILSSLLLSYKWFEDPTQNVLVPFYIALLSHLVYLGMLIIGLPESLSIERRRASRERHEEEVRVRGEDGKKRDEEAREMGWAKVWVRRGGEGIKRLFAFLRPLGLLLPKKRQYVGENGEEGEDEEDEELRSNIDWGKDLKRYWNPEEVWKDNGESGGGVTMGSRRSGWDWSLTKIAISYASYMCIVAIISVKLQYANYTFDWSAREDGLFLSYIGVLRVVALLVFLPLFIRILRLPAPDPSRPKPSEGDEVELKKWEKEKKWLKVVTDSHFDLRLARLSLLLDFLGFLAFSLISLSSHPTSIPFLLSTFLQSLGSGASPTLQSLALAHSTPRDSGRLFASFSVVQSLSAQVIGPVVFGTTFINTVGKGKWTGSVFWLAMGLCAISWICVSSLKLRKVYVTPWSETENNGSVKVDSRVRGRSETRRD